MNFECPMCFYVATSQHSFIKHCLARHRHDSQFIGSCTFQGCQYRTKSWNAFKIHHKRKHGLQYDQIRMRPNALEVQDASSEEEDDLNPQEQVVVDVGSDEKKKKRSLVMRLAKYYLSLEGDYKLTKKAIDNITDSTREIATLVVDECLNHFGDFLRQNFVERDEVLEDMKDMNRKLNCNVMASCDLFLTPHNREYIYDELCRLVRPQEVVMGYKFIKRRNKTKRVPVTGYYVPLIAQLKALMQLPELAKYILNGNINAENGDWMTDVCHGEVLRNNHMTLSEIPFIQIALSFDDIEIQNPLRSSQKYKLGMFYFSILNIPVQFRRAPFWVAGRMVSLLLRSFAGNVMFLKLT